MAKYDLDDSRSDPRARRSNRIALAGLIATLALVVYAGWIQSHPWQQFTTGASQPSWFQAVNYQNQEWQPAGPAINLPDQQMQRQGTTADKREVYMRVGGGGGGGAQPLYVRLSPGYYLPIKRR